MADYTSQTPSLFGDPSTPKAGRRFRRPPRGFLHGTRPVEWKAGCGLWQARLWVGPEHGGSVSLGLYRSEHEAHVIWDHVNRRLEDGDFSRFPRALACWRILRKTPGARRNVLPLWVRRRKPFFIGRKTLEGWRYETSLLLTPTEAFLELWAQVRPTLERLYPPEPLAASYSLFDSLSCS